MTPSWSVIRHSRARPSPCQVTQLRLVATCLFVILAAATIAPRVGAEANTNANANILGAMGTCRFDDAKQLFDSQEDKTSLKEDPQVALVADLPRFGLFALQSGGKLSCDTVRTTNKVRIPTCERDVQEGEILRLPEGDGANGVKVTCANIVPVAVLDANPNAVLTLEPNGAGERVVLQGRNQYKQKLPNRNYKVRAQCADRETTTPIDEPVPACSMIRAPSESEGQAGFRVAESNDDWTPISHVASPGIHAAAVEPGSYEVAWRCGPNNEYVYSKTIDVAAGETWDAQGLSCFTLLSPLAGTLTAPDQSINFIESNELFIAAFPEGAASLQVGEESPFEIEVGPDETHATVVDQTPPSLTAGCWVAAGVGLALATVGLVQYQSKKDEATSTCGPDLDACPASQRDEVESLQRDATVYSALGLSGGAMAVVSLSLLWGGAFSELSVEYGAAR